MDSSKMSAFLTQLKRSEWAGPFLKPVDVKRLQLDDYLDVIKKPMDLQTVGRRVRDEFYKNDEEAFFADLQLIWDNCKEYNGEDSEVYRMALEMERATEALKEKVHTGGNLAASRSLTSELGGEIEAAERRTTKRSASSRVSQLAAAAAAETSDSFNSVGGSSTAVAHPPPKTKIKRTTTPAAAAASAHHSESPPLKASEEQEPTQAAPPTKQSRRSKAKSVGHEQQPVTKGSAEAERDLLMEQLQRLKPTSLAIVINVLLNLHGLAGPAPVGGEEDKSSSSSGSNFVLKRVDNESILLVPDSIPDDEVGKLKSLVRLLAFRDHHNEATAAATAGVVKQ